MTKFRFASAMEFKGIMIIRTYFIYAAGIVAGGYNFSAQADDPVKDTHSRSVTMGGYIQNAPKYSGSDEDKWTALPLIQANQGAFFFDSTRGAGYDLQFSDKLYFEHIIGYDLGRADHNSNWQDGSDKLKGMGGIKATATTSLTLGYQFAPWLATEFMTTIPLTDNQGVRYQFSAKGGLMQTKTDTIAFEGDLLLSGQRYTNIHYGVNAEQSINSGYHEYSVAGGIYGQSLSFDWLHQFTPHWSTDLNLGFTHLSDKVSDSPIVFRQDSSEVSFAVMYTY